MDTQRVLLIINPVSGKARGRSALFPITDALCRAGYLPTVYTTDSCGDARRAAVQLAAEHDLVICLGGDGTLNEVMDGLLSIGSTVPIGYIPTGSTNDFASSLRLKHQPMAALRDIIHGDIDDIDVGLFNGERHFSYIASFGIFTAASYSAPQSAKNVLGHLAYLLEGSKELFTAQSYRIRVETEGRVCEGDYLFGAVCNSTSVAGLVRLNKGVVDMSDGLFEVILVRHPQNAAELARILNSINTGEFDPQMFEFFKASQATFTMPTALPWSLDGERADGGKTVTVCNVPRAIRLKH